MAEFAGGEVLPVSVAEQFGYDALALRSDGRIRVLVASFHDDERMVRIELPAAQVASVRYLDETTYGEAGGDPDFFRGSGGQHLMANDGVFSVRLLPFAVACLDIQGQVNIDG